MIKMISSSSSTNAENLRHFWEPSCKRGTFPMESISLIHIKTFNILWSKWSAHRALQTLKFWGNSKKVMYKVVRFPWNHPMSFIYLSLSLDYIFCSFHSLKSVFFSNTSLETIAKYCFQHVYLLEPLTT